MAKFISIHSSGSGLDGGDVLIGVDGIVGVDAASGTSTVITTPSVRDAINYALTANPGGVKAKVKLPSGIEVSNVVWS